MLKKINFRPLIIALLAASTWLFVNAFSDGDRLRALAEDASGVTTHRDQLQLTAEKIKYHTEKSSGEYLGDNAQYQIEKGIDTVRDKLNTDESLTQKAQNLVDLAKEKTQEVLDQTPDELEKQR